MDHDLMLHPLTKEAIHKVVHTCPTKLAKERLAAVFKVRKMSSDLSQKEVELKSSMYPDVSRCVHILQLEFDCRRISSIDPPLFGVIYYSYFIVGSLKKHESGVERPVF